MKERYKLTVEPITPVHIGTGKTLTPLEYIIKETKNTKEKKYVRFDDESILSRVASNPEDAKKFDTISQKGNMKEIRKFFHENFKGKKDLMYMCPMTKEFISKYDKNIERDPLENAMEVLEMYRVPITWEAVIPGTSLKGSIRTAVLNYLLDQKIPGRQRHPLTKKDDQKKQKEILEIDGDYAKKDPFRSVSISDCMHKKTRNGQIVGLLKNISFDKETEELKALQMQMQAECISGSLIGAESYAEGIISIDKDLNSLNIPAGSIKITINEIRTACNNFFIKEFNKELIKFYPNETDNTQLIDRLCEELEEINKSDNSFLIRIGRWSQVEYVTMDGFRNPKTPRGKNGVPKRWGGTRTVFDYDGQFIPMGWCKCTIEKL